MNFSICQDPVTVKKRVTRSLRILYLEKRKDAHFIVILYIVVIAEYTVKKKRISKKWKWSCDSLIFKLYVQVSIFKLIIAFGGSLTTYLTRFHKYYLIWDTVIWIHIHALKWFFSFVKNTFKKKWKKRETSLIPSIKNRTADKLTKVPFCKQFVGSIYSNVFLRQAR